MAALQAGDALELTWVESETISSYPSIQELEDGSCLLRITHTTGTGTIDDGPAALTTLASTVGQVVEEHGFEPLSEIQNSEVNGDLWVDSSDPTGWGVEIRGGGQSSPEWPDAVVELTIDGPVATDTCDDATLQEALADAG